MFFPSKFDRHVEALKAMIVCTTSIQRILPQLQSMGLCTVKDKISNNGNGMTNNAVSTKWYHHESRTMGCLVFRSNFSTLFLVIHFVTSNSELFP